MTKHLIYGKDVIIEGDSLSILAPTTFAPQFPLTFPSLATPPNPLVITDSAPQVTRSLNVTGAATQSNVYNLVYQRINKLVYFTAQTATGTDIVTTGGGTATEFVFPGAFDVGYRPTAIIILNTTLFVDNPSGTQVQVAGAVRVKTNGDLSLSRIDGSPFTAGVNIKLNGSMSGIFNTP